MTVHYSLLVLATQVPQILKTTMRDQGEIQHCDNCTIAVLSHSERLVIQPSSNVPGPQQPSGRLPDIYICR